MTETINDTVLRLTTFMRESYPAADLGPGSVLSELLVKLAATAQNQQYNNITTLQEGSSIYAVENSAEPDALTPDIIDRIASNYFTARATGTHVTGRIKVSVTTSRSYSLAQGFTFVQPSSELNYVTPALMTYSISPTIGQGQLYTETGGFYFIVDIVAQNVGTQYQVTDLTEFAIGAGFGISNLVSTTAYGNFTSGSNTQTNSELVGALRLGMSTKTMTSPVSIESRLKEAFPDVRNVSLIGVGDPEMNRASNNVFGLNTPGYVDAYIRSTFGMEEFEIVKEVAAPNANGNSSFVLNYQDTSIAGFYRVVSVLPSSGMLTGSFAIVSQTYDYQLPTTGVRVNYVADNDDARFSKYQRATVVFKNTTGATSVTVKVTGQRNIEDIQALMLSSSERIPCADYLVRSVLPCFVNLTIPLILKKGVSINTANLRAAVFTYVNSVPFGESVYASRIVDICHNYNIRRVDLPIILNGEILGLDSSSTTIRDQDVLSIPTSNSKGISPNTVMFFASLSNIGITLGQ